MAQSHRQLKYTVDEYLVIERSSDERHEFLDGVIYAMAGESDEHADISVNLTSLLWSQLKGTSCRVRSKDTKVRSGPVPKGTQSKTGLYSYPDLLVVCGDPLYHDEHTDVLLNPKVIVEVLSPTTEAFDRGEKFRRYNLWNPTLSDYLLVCQDRPQIEHHIRQSDGAWSCYWIDGLDGIVRIPSINCQLKLSEVYDRITFGEE